MNEWEIIGRFVDLDNRLRTLEGRPTVQEKPQPVAGGLSLIEACEALLKHYSDEPTPCSVEEGKAICRVRHALTAEHKRAELVENLIDAARRFYQENDGRYDLLRVRLSELDAFDKGVENG